MYTHSTEAGWISRSHAAIRGFRLRKPETVADAVAALAEPGATAIAGGIDLIRRMRGGDCHEVLVDLSRIEAMSGIEDRDGSIRIGALASHWDIETDKTLAARLPDFQAAWKTIGNVRVRMAGTLGGNLMAVEPGYDGRVLLGALGASAEIATGDGSNVVVPVAEPDTWPAAGLLVAVSVPASPAARLSFDRSLKPVVSVAVAIAGGTATVAVGCAYGSPQFWSGPTADIGPNIADAFAPPIENAMGSSAYRRRMIGVLAQRQVRALNGEG